MDFKQALIVGGIDMRASSKKFPIMLAKAIFMASTIMLTVSAFADGGSRKVPGIDHSEVYKVPENLTAMATKEVESLRSARQQDLKKLRNGGSSKQIAEENMFTQLMAHDEVRLTITDVIPKLIEDYAIEGKFKNTLMGYRSTFVEEISESRENVHSLQDYQSYDFRFTAVYMSMLFAFHEHPEFYQQLKTDMDDEETSIGGYRKRLDDSYVQVEQAREQMEVIHTADDLENVIVALDEELARRSH